MTNKQVASAEAYYAAMLAKDFSTVKSMLHPEIRVVSPIAEIQGLDTALASMTSFASFLKGFKVRSKFGSENQAMLAYDMECPEPIGRFRGASLITFKDNLIAHIELFYDARPFEKMGIFSKAK